MFEDQSLPDADDQVSVSADSWYLNSPNGELGPFPATRVRGFIRDRLMPPEATVRNALSGDVMPASRLFARPASCPPASPPLHGAARVPAAVIDADSAPACFGPARVQFQGFTGQGDARLRGKGTVSVSDGVLAITGRRRRLFAWGRRTECIPLAQVQDVIVEGRFLRFAERLAGDVPLKPGKDTKPRLLRLDTPERAQALAACLPDKLSETARQTIADTAEFQGFLEAAGPAVVTLAIIALNAAIFLFEGIKGAGWMAGDANVLLELGGNLATATAAGQWWRLLSAMFLHAGLLHVALNMWALWDAGRVAERLFGRLPYAALYLAAGVLGGIASINWQQDIVSVGASGAVFGVYGALLAALLLRKDLLPLSIAKKLQASASVMIIYSLFNGMTKVGIDNAAHIGGLVAGVLIGAALVIPARRALVAATATLVLIGAGAVRAIEVAEPFRDDLPYRQFIKHYGMDEPKLNAQLQQLAARAREIPSEAFAKTLETELIPRWQAHDQAISRLVHVSPRMRPVRDALARFIHLRHESLLLLRDAARFDDVKKFAEFQNRNAEIAAVAAEIARMGAQASKKGGGQ